MTLTQPNEKEGYSAGERMTGSTEDGEWLWRTSAKGQERLARHGSGKAIIMKKRFVPEKFLSCACSYEGRLNSRRVWVRALSYLRARAACSCTCYVYGKLTHKLLGHAYVYGNTLSHNP